ncbi:MAG: PhnB protein [Crocinitomix sp.]|jgi:PhnB protein
MNSNFDTFRPEGFSNVNSYLFVENPQELIDYLIKSFHAEELNRTLRPDNGTIANVVLKIGDTCIMLSQANGPFMGMRTSFYLFVKNVDEMYKRAIENGGTSVFEPSDQEFGDRQGGIEDPAGNYWWISTRLTETNY